jgi:hypothetical protein
MLDVRFGHSRCFVIFREISWIVLREQEYFDPRNHTKPHERNLCKVN